MLSLCFNCPELESKQELVLGIRKFLQSLPRPVVIVMRYLFAFLHQYVSIGFFFLFFRVSDKKNAPTSFSIRFIPLPVYPNMLMKI